MNIRLKILGLGVLAILAMSSFAAMNATATVNGHFASDVSHTILSGTGTEKHFTEFSVEGNTPIRCTSESYSGTINVSTTQEVTIVPSYSNCETTGAAPPTWEVHENKCHFLFNSRTQPADGTVSVQCPDGKAIEITHPNCNITVPTQSSNGVHMTGGVGYTNIPHPTKHAITVTSTVTNITAEYHGGICIFLGTNHTAAMSGAAIITGSNTEGAQVGITNT